MEPFSTSVFKDLIWIFATTTKICTNGCFTPAHADQVASLIYTSLEKSNTYKPSRPPTRQNVEFVMTAEYRPHA